MQLQRTCPLLFLAGVAIGSLGVAAAEETSTPTGQKGCAEAVIVANADDAGPGSLRAAVAAVCDGGTITFAERFVIALASELDIERALVIDGSSVSVDAGVVDDNLVQILGGATHRAVDVGSSGDLTLRRVRISNGVADNQGGGVRNAGRLGVFESRFDGNADNGSNPLGGGAIFNNVDATLLVEASTFDGNDAERGSAIFNAGQAELRNSTFSGNIGNTFEGAIQNRGTLLALHITVTNNGRPDAGFGGLFAFNADTTLVNSVFADNVGRNCFISGGTVTSTGLLAQSGNCNAQLFDDPQLGTLAANGGVTRTHALPLASATVDAADGEFCLETDQRGVSRPQGDACDLGAFEARSLHVFADGFETR